MLATMDSEHDNFVVSGAEIDGIRESRQHRATSLGMDTPEQEGVVDKRCDESLDRLAELSPQAGAT